MNAEREEWVSEWAAVEGLIKQFQVSVWKLQNREWRFRAKGMEKLQASIDVLERVQEEMVYPWGLTDLQIQDRITILTTQLSSDDAPPLHPDTTPIPLLSELSYLHRHLENYTPAQTILQRLITVKSQIHNRISPYDFSTCAKICQHLFDPIHNLTEIRKIELAAYSEGTCLTLSYDRDENGDRRYHDHDRGDTDEDNVTEDSDSGIIANPYSVTALLQFATTLRRTRWYKTAEKMLLKLRGEVEKAMGKETFEFSGNLLALGELWFHLSRFKEAEMVFLEAVEIRRRLFEEQPEGHILGHILGKRAIDKVGTWLLEVWTRLGKLWNVEWVLRRRLKAAEEGEDGHHAMQGMMQLGRCFMDQKRWEEAEGFLRRLLRLGIGGGGG
ncbi:Similar to Kinesin light chain 2; acc. no. Q9H0B6 [Pyronema omphalodes CBS 100304]|uniref:Similar to Kinesin light chain 2 acc. no. Q9H0B6 n=1 Tax=Pyronema omphalodes (strain CBS 100304) TaxID=1076935 RepID=U4LDL2_PYROM|nr:Similar to Kinesin light chain 2; acc. no. Q9H0B6 [Pyronema omphalodes CBS 100304]